MRYHPLRAASIRSSSSRGTMRRTGGTTGTFNRGTGGTNRRRTTPTGGGTRRRGRGMLWQPNRIQLDQNMLHQPAAYGTPIVTSTIVTPSLLSAIMTGLLGNAGPSRQNATDSNGKAAREFVVVDLIDNMTARFKRSLGLDRARDWWKKAAEREIARLRIERRITTPPVAVVEKPAEVKPAGIEPDTIESEFTEMAEALRAVNDQGLSLEMPAIAATREIAAAMTVAIDAAAAPAQDAGQAPARQPRNQDQPKQEPQRQETLDERLLQGVSGELKGEVTATVIDGGTIFITGDEDDIAFIELLAAAMELSAPKPEIAVFTLNTASAAALAPALEQTIQGIMDV
ncbi:MAG: hypothetical protein IIB55_08245, partial [Planctomycetes bacterium]|nr:hypothetical protein [Planctomycetota bacterium]